MEIKGKHIYTVSQLTEEISVILENTFPNPIWVEGEISNFKIGPSGHFYFSLKDEKAVLAAAMFLGANRKVKFKLEDGLKVICFGEMRVYSLKGQYQLIVEEIEPKGIGSRQLAFEQLKEKLAKEGFFDLSRKKQLPLLPQKIGIVTSLNGAAIRDILAILKKGASFLEIIIRPVRVQGELASSEIAEGIRELNEYGKIDAIIVSRGGGSTEDLWAFNEESCVRAVFESKIPIISAVGHQINTTLCDLTADFFVETPTAAAKLIVDKKNAFLNEVVELKYEMSRLVTEKIQYLKQEVVRLRFALKSPKDRILEKEQFLDEITFSLHTNIRQKILLMQEKFKKLSASLDALSPLKVLVRGYSVSLDASSGEVLKDFSQLKPSQLVKTILSKGSFLSRVEHINEERI